MAEPPHPGAHQAAETDPVRIAMPDPGFWRGRRVFVTGHTGFKGSWLGLWLRMLDADVTGYALEPPTVPSMYDLAGVDGTLRSIRADVRDFEALRGALDSARPDVVIHMAAQSVVRMGYQDPVGTYSTNVMGTVNIFECLRQLGRPCAVVNVTSDKCYANREWIWGYREIEPMGGRDPYSSSKGCAELVTDAFRESFFPPGSLERHGIAVASARAGNAVGGGDWTQDQLIPDLVRAFLEGRACRIRNPAALRPWQFVLEPLRGYLLLAERLAQGGAAFAAGWNFGPSERDALPVSWVADRMAQAWGQAARWERDSQAHPPEAQCLRLDSSRAAALLSWRPILPLDIAIDWIVEWYLGYAAGRDVRRLSEEQIERFRGLAPAGV